MSTVLITHHNENIHSHMEPSPPVTPRTPRYESELEKFLKAQKRPQTRRTFGYAETPMNRPENYLRKGGGIQPPVKVVVHPPKPCETQGAKLPSLPATRRAPPPPRPKATVNYRVQNIRNVHRAKGKTREGLLVINNKGDTKKLAGSGAIPEYSRRPDYGQMPEYLVKLNERLCVQRQRATAKKSDWKDPCVLVEQEEKQALLENLKQAWSRMQNRYICLPILIDTAPKIMKKANIERQLGQLEKDIAFLESNPYIYVYDDAQGEKACYKKCKKGEQDRLK